MLIYKATNRINNKCYIGQTITLLKQRKAVHISQSKSNMYDMIFHKAIRKYGKDNFKWEIICECKTQDEMNKLERLHMLENNSLAPYGYNAILNVDHSKKKSNGRLLNITEDELYVAISKSNSIKEVSDFLGIASTTAKRYLKKYNFYKYMFEKSRKNCKYSHKQKYDKNILS